MTYDAIGLAYQAILHPSAARELTHLGFAKLDSWRS